MRSVRGGLITQPYPVYPCQVAIKVRRPYYPFISCSLYHPFHVHRPDIAKILLFKRKTPAINQLITTCSSALGSCKRTFLSYIVYRTSCFVHRVSYIVYRKWYFENVKNNECFNFVTIYNLVLSQCFFFRIVYILKL